MTRPWTSAGHCLAGASFILSALLDFLGRRYHRCTGCLKWPGSVPFVVDCSLPLGYKLFEGRALISFHSTNLSARVKTGTFTDFVLHEQISEQGASSGGRGSPRAGEAHS